MLKLKRFSEGVWFDYPAGGRFRIRPIMPKDYLEIREKCKTGKTFVFKGVVPELVDNYDESLMVWKVFDFMLQEWADVAVEGASDKAQEKEAIFNDMPLRDWIAERSAELKLAHEAKLGTELKNSETS